MKSWCRFATLPVLGIFLSCAQSADIILQSPRALSSYDDQVNELLAQMTLEEKVGQMTQPDQEFLVEESDIEALFLGSLLSGGNSDPPTNSLEDWTAMYERYQTRALNTRLKIPLIYGVDAVHGHNNVLGAVIFPHNIGLGCTRNPELVERAAEITAQEVRATGINWTFSPSVAVPRDERWGRTYEGFSEDPELVKVLGEAAVRGYQGGDLSDPLRILACAKHYLGDGGTTWGTGVAREGRPYGLDQGDTQMDEQTLRRIHLPGYLTAIEAGVGSIMPSYSSWNGEKLSGHKYLLTTVLKEELGFEGFLISDYNAIDQLPGDYKSDIEQAINAGMDMVMVTGHYRDFIRFLKELAEEGRVPMARIDDAVRRILRVKFAMGLIESSPMPDRELWTSFGSAEHREVARECVRQSLVLLKNENRVLPAAKSAARIHVVGKSADDLGNMCGGWTIDWQGKSGEVTPGGTTILQAIRQSVSTQTQVTVSSDGNGADGADVAFVVIGETPYAEMMGDNNDLSLAQEDIEAVANVRRAGVPVVVILVSGRPMIVDSILDQCDALVAAWLPGTEGQGVADVIFGDYNPTGKLSFSWPRSMDQIPINVGDENYNPLFEYGFGLNYGR
jgi:beta-glucosidase